VKIQSIAPSKEEEQVTQEDKNKLKDSIKLLKANKL
jgi:hypothetical protein